MSAEHEEGKRKKVAQEIADTELSYVSCLIEATELYYYPVLKRAGTEEEIISPEQINIVFGNLQQLLTSDKDLLKELQFRIKPQNWSCETCLGDIFIGAFTQEFIKEYCVYVHGFELYLEFMKKIRLDKVNIHKFLAFISQQERKSASKLNLTSLLITPVQRIPRYILLLQELLKSTPENHQDYDNLQQALENMKIIAIYIDEQKGKMAEMRKIETVLRKFKEYDQLSDILSLDRRFEGTITIEENEGGKTVTKHLLILNDYIVCGQPQKNDPNSYHLCWSSDIINFHSHTCDDGGIVFTVKSATKTFPYYEENQYKVQPASKDDASHLNKFLYGTTNYLKSNIFRSNLVNSQNVYNHFSQVLMSDDDWDILKAGSNVVKCSKGDIIYHQGAVLEHVYYIEEGDGIYIKDIGDEQSITFPCVSTISGEFEFLMKLLNENFSTSASFIANTSMTLSKIETQHLENLLFPSLATSCAPLCCTNSTHFSMYFAFIAAYISITSPINTFIQDELDNEKEDQSINKLKTQNIIDWKQHSKQISVKNVHQPNSRLSDSSLAPISRSKSEREPTTQRASTLDKVSSLLDFLPKAPSSSKQRKYEKIITKFGITDTLKFVCKVRFTEDKLLGTLLICGNNVCFVKDGNFFGNTRILIPNNTIKNIIYEKEKTVLIRTIEKNYELSFSDKPLAAFVYSNLLGNSQMAIPKNSNKKNSNNNNTDKYKAMKKSFDTIMRKYSKRVEHNKGAVIVERGVRSETTLYQVSAGSCKLESILNDIVRTQSLRKGEIFGEISFFFGGINIYSVTANRKCTVRTLEFSQLGSIMQNEKETSGLSEFFLYIASITVYRFIKKEYFVIDTQWKLSSDLYSAPEDHYEKADEQEELSRDFKKPVKPKSILSKSMCTEEIEDFQDDDDDE